VETTVANVPDVQMTATIQAELVKTELKPEEHVVDTGYVDADLLVSSHQQGIKLLGPVLSDNRGPRQSGQRL
jgi:transposase